jgi:phage-related protein
VGNAKVIIDILVNSRDSAREMDATASKFDSFGSTMKGLAAPAGIALGALGGLATGAIKAASDMQQASGGVDAVFKESAGTVHDWAKTSAQDVGLAGAEYQTLAAGIGGALTGMGVPLEKATSQTGDLILRAADLASVFGGDTAQATEALTSAFRGEYDSLQRLIPGISAAAVESEMAAEAAAGMSFASEDAAKANAIYTLAMDGSADAAGNFAKESDTVAGSQAIAQAKFKDTAAALGEQLLPAVTKVMELLSSFGTWISEHIPLVTAIAIAIGAMAAAVLLINAGMAVYAAAQTVATVAAAAWSVAGTAATAVTTAFSAAVSFLTGPLGLIILAIAAVIAIVVLLVKNWDTVAEAAKKCWAFIQDACSTALDFIKGAIGTALDWISGQWDTLRDFVSGIWDKIKTAAGTAWEAVKQAAMGPINAIKDAIAAFGTFVTGIWDKIKSAGVAIWEAIKAAAMGPINAIKSAIEAIGRVISTVIQKIKDAINFATTLMSKIPFVGGIFGHAVVPEGASAAVWTSSLVGVAPRLSTPRTPAAAAGGIVINISGALDPVATARTVRRLLVNQDRRTTGVRVS